MHLGRTGLFGLNTRARRFVFTNMAELKIVDNTGFKLQKNKKVRYILTRRST